MDMTLYSASFVEIFGLDEDVKGYYFDQSDPENVGETEVANINGHRGVIIESPATEDEYVIRTFDNFVASVSSDNLRPFDAAAEFDLVWAENAVEEIGLSIVDALGAKGFCTIQMFASPSARGGMLSEADALPAFRMKQELESAYFGLANGSKLGMLPTQDSSSDSAFTASREHVAQVGGVLRGTTAVLGFDCTKQTATYVRSSYKSDGEKLMITPTPIEDAENWGSEVADYIWFMENRKLCLLEFIDNNGGDIWLYPRDASGEQSARLTIAPNRLFIFRHDWFDYSYQPLGQSLALQTWLTHQDTVPIETVEINLREGFVFGNPGVPETKGAGTNILSAHSITSGAISNEKHMWAFLTAGGDGISQWPTTRSYDLDLYYSSDMQTSFLQGKSYAKHGGFTEEDTFSQFDNRFFGISDRDSIIMIPTARWLMEAGIAGLLKAGYTTKSLKGQPIGSWVGDSGMDWSGLLPVEWAFKNPDFSMIDVGMNVSPSYTAARLAYLYGLTGPVLQADTACSSSLVALTQAQSFMVGSVDGYSAKSLVMGVNCMVGVMGYLACTSGNMLGPIGRSFTWNASAEGYTRGEFCGSAYLERNEESRDGRLCSLVGCVANHDGRSATLTAPSGPAQTELIVKCLRSAGIDDQLLTITEYHGTGTPLGDPIEVGAFRNALKKRVVPVVSTCNKSHIGHKEPGAGIAGLVKTVLLSLHSVGTPNCHLNILNPNIEIAGYPDFQGSELMDTNRTTGYCGVTSMGFAGSNARADVYYETRVGTRKALRLELPPISLPTTQFSFEEDEIYIVGSWSNWTSVDLLEQEDEDTCTRSCFIRLGAARVEYFQLKLGDLLEEENEYATFFPALKNSDSSAQVFGPSKNPPNHSWMISGIADDKPEGTVYKISFGLGGTKVWWVPTADSEIAGEILGS